MKRLIAVVLLSSLITAPVWAGEAKVTWENPDRYRDVRAAEENQARFEQRVFAGLEAHFQVLAERLPEGHKLDVTVKDLDLAGEVLPNQFGSSIGLVRTIRNSDFPAIEFAFSVTDADGKVVSEGHERLRGRDLPGQGLTYSQSRSPDESFDYERAMLDRWFRFRFEQ